MIEKHVLLVITNNRVRLPHVEAIDRISITLTQVIISAHLEFCHAKTVPTEVLHNVLHELIQMQLALVETEIVIVAIIIHTGIHLLR